MIKILERLGVPRTLMLGFLAVAIFMTGDGFELTFTINIQMVLKHRKKN